MSDMLLFSFRNVAKVTILTFFLQAHLLTDLLTVRIRRNVSDSPFE